MSEAATKVEEAKGPKVEESKGPGVAVMPSAAAKPAAGPRTEFSLMWADGRIKRFRLDVWSLKRFEQLSAKAFGEFDVERVSDICDMLVASSTGNPLRAFASGAGALGGGLGPAFLAMNSPWAAEQELRREVEGGLPLEEKPLLRVQLALLQAYAAARGRELPAETLASLRQAACEAGEES